MFRSLRRTSTRIGRWPRLCAAGICLVLAVSSAVDSARAHRSQRLVTVVVAAHDLSAGRVLHRADVRSSRWPSSLAPLAAVQRSREVVGRRLVAPLASGEVITPVRLLGGGPASTVPAGRVPVAITVDTDSAALVRPGERVDVIGVTSPDTGVGPDVGTGRSRAATASAPVVRGGLLMAVLPGDTSASAEPSTRLVLAATRPEALQIAQRRAVEAFTVMRSGP